MTGSLWFYSKDESTNVDNNIANANNFKSLGIRLNYQGTHCVNPHQIIATELQKIQQLPCH